MSSAGYVLIRRAVSLFLLSRVTAQHTLPDDSLVLFEPIVRIEVENHSKVLFRATVLQLL